MKIQEFLKHHGISRNPFAEEDAQTDVVFKNHCIDSIFHVGWDKVYGDPVDPSTSIVFGEKGAGKTALKLQIKEHIEEHNKTNPTKKVFVIEYDDFNPYLDRFRNHFGSRFRRADKLLGAWRLWDHMDAILSLGVTRLTDEIVESESIDKAKLRGLPPHIRRDVMLLASCYDQGKNEAMPVRWNKLASRLGFWTWKAKLPLLYGILGLVVAGGLFAYVMLNNSGMLSAPADAAGDGAAEPASGLSVPVWVYAAIIVVGWLPWLYKAIQRLMLSASIVRKLRVSKQYVNPLRRVLMNFTSADILGQPFPNRDRTDDRYELMGKFQNVLEELGYVGIVVLMDRLDEPHLINGQAELMRAFLWPMLDNKFLKHPGVGIKMMLPIELRRFVDREDRDFYQRSRLDKQNMIPSLQWTGSALYDLAASRIAAVAIDGQSPSTRAAFEDNLSDERLIDGFQSLRTPRHLFKFLYRLLVAHCNAHTDEHPSYQISREQFETVLAVYRKEIEAADSGVGV